MTFQWPEFLWLGAALPVLVALYLYVLRRRKKFAVRYSSLALIKQAMAGASWRRHVPPAILLLALHAAPTAPAAPAVDRGAHHGLGTRPSTDAPDGGITSPHVSPPAALRLRSSLP